MSNHLSHHKPASPVPGVPSAQTLLSVFDGPALITGERHDLRAFNSDAASLLSLSDDSIGAPLSRLLRSSSRSQLGSLNALIESDQLIEGETMVPARFDTDGGTVSGAWSVLPIPTEDDESYLLHHLIEQREEETDRSGMEFLANVTHELRTPLSALVATTELMLHDYEKIPSSELGQMISLMHRNTRRLEALVSNLLDAAGLQTGKLHLRKTVSSVDSLVRDASEFVSPLLRSKNQRLETRTLGGLPTLVVDPKRIIGVLVNLLSNASRYGPPNEPIQLMVSGERTLVRFTVRQRGPGIPRQEQSLLFQRFYRASTGEKATGGSGLGLAIVKDIVEMHGGTVGLLSNPGNTTAFWFTVPVEGTVN